MPFAYVRTMPAMADLLETVDRKDVRTVECHKSMREFIAGLLSYMPGWMKFLYAVRNKFVLLLGQRPTEVPTGVRLQPEDVPFTPGDPAAFFTVTAAEADRYWAAEARDGMIAGYIAVAVEPLPDGVNRFHVLTMAKYLAWTGRMYYNIINVFHHIVVHYMVRHAAK